MNRGGLIVHGTAKSWTQLSNYACTFVRYWASQVAQVVRSPPAMWKTQLQLLGWEDPLEKGMATHSSILATHSSSPMDRGLQSMGLQSRTRLSG